MKVNLGACTGKTVFVGIDVHKATYSVVVVCDGAIVLKVGSMPAEPAALVDFLKKRFPESCIKTAYEAGFSGFVLHRALVEADIDSMVVHAASIEVAANDRVKNDKRDATKIAWHLSRGMLRGIRVPTVQEELQRQLTRTRAQLIKERTRVGNQIKSKLLLFGLIGPTDKRVMSAKRIKELRAQSFPPELAVAISALSDVWETIYEQAKHLDQKMAQQAKSQQKLEKIYRSTPGVGDVIGRTLANELGDMSQFKNERQLFNFLGLTPSEHSSGPKEKRGHITRQGRGQLRGMLVEAAWKAIGDDPALNEVYERLKVTRGGKRAIVAVARRIAGRIRACLRKETTYEIDYGKAVA